MGIGAITIEVVDDYAPWNNGVFTFRSNAGKLEVESGDSAETSLSINGLSSLIYGLHDPLEFNYLGYGEVSEEHAAKLRALFPRQEVYIQDLF